MSVTISKMLNSEFNEGTEFELSGLSTDPKPSEVHDLPVGVNSLFLELDTGDFYFLETPAQSSEEVLIPQTSFVADTESGNYYYIAVRGITFSNESIIVEFDEVKYECNLIDGAYGAPFDDYTDIVDFSDYPFAITNDSDDTYILVQDDNEHTIEVYTETTTPAVWKKVGSGASPSEEGYEINNPILTFEVNNQSETPVSLSYGAVNNDGYLAYERLDAPVGESIINLVVTGLFENGETRYESDILISPSIVNYTDNCSFSDNVITITDPSQDAVINIEFNGLG